MTRVSNVVLSKRISAALIVLVLTACSGGKQQTTNKEASGKASRAMPSPPQTVESHVGAPLPPGKGVTAEGRLREKWHGDVDGIAKRRFLRILVAPSKLGFHFNGSQMEGAIYEFSREFEAFLNKKLHTSHAPISAVFIPAGRESLIPMLAEGPGDLVASLVGVSERRQAMVDFTDPLYEHAKAVIVGGPGA